jgi:hypothetical protein
VAALQLDVDAAPRFIDPIARGDDAVAHQDVDHPGEHQQSDDDQDDHHWRKSYPLWAARRAPSCAAA